MTDRELLEAAAKAVGMSLTDNGVRDLGNWEWLRAGDHEWGLYRNNANGTQRRWNPLLDDGDALRLAVKLNLRLVFHPALNQALVRPYHSDSKETESCENGEAHTDPYAATRRAIVRGAAAMAAQGVSGAA